MAPRKQQFDVPEIILDTIREKSQMAYRQSRDKRLLTDTNGKICRQLAEYFPMPVELAIIEQVFCDEWFNCAKEQGQVHKID